MSMSADEPRVPPDAPALRPLPQLIFSSRWLQLPLYLGLIVAQGVYVVLFLKELWHLVLGAMRFTEQEIMLVVLGLIDVVMISNLLIMVIVGGYETFVSRLELERHPDQPEWLSHVNASVLKIKLAMAIIGISSIHLLRTFIYAGSLGKPEFAVYRDRRDVAGDHPRPVRAVGDRHRLCRISEPVDQREASTLGHRLRVTAIIIAALLLLAAAARADDAGFQQWLQGAWPAAEKFGVSRPTFDKAIAGLEPDLTLPDLVVPGRPEKAPSQPEFVQTPAQYLREASFQRLAARGQQLAAQYKDTLARISREFGVPGNVVLAIWARETDYGSYKLPHDALRVLATQAYTGKRKDFFRNEFLHALKMLQDGVPRGDLRSSWGGAMGLTQFLPSEFYKYAVDFDHDGRADIFHSVPDALASAAKQLAGKGWVSGVHWAYEVKAPANADCTMGVPEVTATIGEWEKRGFAPIGPRRPGARDLATTASLLQPEGAYGPAFLATKNYFVLKDYNYSDLYVLFVGHLSDRIGGAGPFVTPWSKNAQLKTREVETMQERLTALGLYRDKLDGKAGMLTRAALGAYQKKNGLKVDCWPTAAVLAHMRR